MEFFRAEILRSLEQDVNRGLLIHGLLFRLKNRPIPHLLWICHLPGTYRTPCFLLPCAGVNHRLPHMALRARPPDFVAAPCGHIFWGEGPVERRMPACRHGRIQSCQIVKPHQDFSSRAIGAIRTTDRSGAHCRLIFMPQGSEPIIRDFLANNAYMLKQLIENTANIR